MVDNADKPVVLVTGASAGIGEAICKLFAEKGYRVVAVARTQSKLDALAKSLSGITDVLTYAGDAAAPETPVKAVALTIEKFGRLDCLVNNAGTGKWAPAHLTDDDLLEEVIGLSMKAPIRFCREAVGHMKSGGSIVNVGSIWGLLGGMNAGAYSAVKAGLVGFTATMAAQYGSQGIRTNLVAPGVIKTDMTKDIWTENFFTRINQEMTPIHREGTVEDVANAVWYLSSPEGGYINGQTIAVDGGWATTKFLCEEAMNR